MHATSHLIKIVLLDNLYGFIHDCLWTKTLYLPARDTVEFVLFLKFITALYYSTKNYSQASFLSCSVYYQDITQIVNRAIAIHPEAHTLAQGVFTFTFFKLENILYRFSILITYKTPFHNDGKPRGTQPTWWCR